MYKGSGARLLCGFRRVRTCWCVVPSMSRACGATMVRSRVLVPARGKSHCTPPVPLRLLMIREYKHVILLNSEKYHKLYRYTYYDSDESSRPARATAETPRLSSNNSTTVRTPRSPHGTTPPVAARSDLGSSVTDGSCRAEVAGVEALCEPCRVGVCFLAAVPFSRANSGAWPLAPSWPTHPRVTAGSRRARLAADVCGSWRDSL